ncbi:MAG: hypothetical protein WKG07_21065 [Hymenobacter sp.]
MMCCRASTCCPACCIDQHFAERARYPRLLHAVLAYPHLLGLGLSEETGLGSAPRPARRSVWRRSSGARGLRPRLTNSNYAEPIPGRPVSGQGFRVSLLVAGDTVVIG